LQSGNQASDVGSGMQQFELKPLSAIKEVYIKAINRFHHSSSACKSPFIPAPYNGNAIFYFKICILFITNIVHFSDVELLSIFSAVEIL